MLARAHGLIAFGTLATIATIVEPKSIGNSTLFLCLVFNTIGSMLPDIDQASNRLWDMFPAGEKVGKALGVFMRHRGISHSILGVYLIDRFSFWFTSNIFNESFVDTKLVYWSMMIGVISHIFADSVTEEGVPLLYPLKMKFGVPPVKRWRIKTGGWFENLVVLPMTTFFIAWLLVTYWPVFANLV